MKETPTVFVRRKLYCLMGSRFITFVVQVDTDMLRNQEQENMGEVPLVSRHTNAECSGVTGGGQGGQSAPQKIFTGKFLATDHENEARKKGKKWEMLRKMRKNGKKKNENGEKLRKEGGK